MENVPFLFVKFSVIIAETETYYLVHINHLFILEMKYVIGGNESQGTVLSG